MAAPTASFLLAASPFFGEGKALPGLLWFKMFLLSFGFAYNGILSVFPSPVFFFFLLGSFKAFPCPYRIPQWEQ